MLLFSSSSSLFVSSSRSRNSSTTTSRKCCSVFKVPVIVVAFILVNFVISNSTVDAKQKSDSYYQKLERHLNSFTIKDDPEDLLALPSDSGPSVVVVAPPPSIARNGPITQYARIKANREKANNSSLQTDTQKLNKSKSFRQQRQYQQSKQQGEDNVAQESKNDGDTVSYAAPPPGFTNKMLHHRTSGSDNLAQESYQSNAYAPPPPPPATSKSSLSAATARSYDQYLRNSVKTAAAKDNQAEESYQSESYAPAPESTRIYPQYHRSIDGGSSDSGSSKLNDNQAQESYNSRAYAPPPSSLTPAEGPPPPPPSAPSASRKSYYDQYLRGSSSSSATNDNYAQESYQTSMAYAPAPPPGSASSVTSAKSIATPNDNYAQESYQSSSMSYAPPAAPAPPQSSVNYSPIHYHNSPPSSYYSQSGGATPSASPPYSPSSNPPYSPSSNPPYSPSASPPYSPSANPSYSPSASPSYSPSASPSYSPSSNPPYSPSASPPYSPSTYGSPEAAPSRNHHTYYHPQSASQTPVDHDDAKSGPYYAPYPATTPPPASRAEHQRHLSHYPTPKPTILQPATKNEVSASASSYQPQMSSSTLLAHHPHLMSIDKHQEEQKQKHQQTAYSTPAAASNAPFSSYPGETFEFSPAPPGPPPPPPVMADSPTSHKDQSSAEDSLQKQQKLLEGALGSGLDIYKLALTSPTKLFNHAFKLLTSLRIPKEHYLNVISFVGVYLFMSILFYGKDELLSSKCDEGDEHMSKEWHYHVGRRFVPAMQKVDKKLQKKFLKLFKGLHLEDDDEDDDGSSSEEDHDSLVNYVNDMCPRGAFFYSMAPMHLEARMQVQKILVAQPSPAHVYSAAKALLYKHKIHPKIWYLGLLAAALERPDMTGFKLAHPIDAIPDWFVPSHLIQDEMDRYRSISLSRSLQKRRIRRAIGGNSTSTKVILTTTPSPSTTTTLSSSTTTVGANSNLTSSSTTTRITRRPLLFTRRSTTTYRPPDISYFSGESGSLENFVLDGTPPHLKGNKFHDYVPSYDEETINDSVQKYQSINIHKEGKYKPKKKARPVQKSPSDNQQEQDASTSASAEADTSNGVDASGSTEADNASNSGDGSSAGNSAQQNSAQQNDAPSNVDATNQDEEVAVIAPAPPSVRPSHLTSSSHNAIKVGDLTVVVGSGPSLLNDIPAYNYNLLDDRDKGHGKKHGGKKGHKKGHKKGKGKGKGKGDGDCIVVDGKVGRDNGIENKLWYFREDMMVNQFHWYWHLAHPVNATKHPDRRAELFFFTHRQFLARYNSERMSNGLHRIVHMNNIGPGGILVEPYHSHLADVASGKHWTPRYPKRLLRDIRHEHDPDIIKNIMLKDVATMYSRLVKSAKTGIMISKQGLLPIRNSKGVEPLANTVEATELSVNPSIYDAFGLHNSGHLVIGLVEDPDWMYKKPPGVMSEVATAVRDPVFFNYHALIDDVIERHKETLQPYKTTGGEFPLLWKGIKILDMEMISKGNGPLNELRTFWTKKKFELAPSVDGSTDKEDEHAKICAVHLAHEPFTFKVTIERKPCAKSKSGKGTIRIFIAPRFDEKGRRIHLREQRRLMIQLDAFQAKLRVGRNIITRRSHDSSLTQPWTKHMHELEERDPSGAADFCGCGWPQHLFIPKGSHKGMPFDLFVMVTNYDEDHVPNHPKDLEIPETCNNPYLMCGHARRKYPDARPMGYPFDRPPYKTPIPCLAGHSFASVVCKSFNLVIFKPVDTLEEYVAKAPNMKSIVFDIKHIDKLVKHYHRRH